MPIRYVTTAANEGLYHAVTWGIGFLGALGIYFLLGEVWMTSVIFVFLYVLVIIGWLYHAYCQREEAEILVSFSRPIGVIVSDILMKTMELSLFSLILDVVGRNKRIEMLLSMKYVIFILVMVLAYLIGLAIYSIAARKERKLLKP